MQNSLKYMSKIYQNLGNLKYDFRNHNLISLIASKVKGNSILDIGCGNGALIHILHKKGKKVIGLEPNKELILLAKKLNQKLKIHQGTAEDINTIIPQKQDAITMIDVLEHIKDDNSQLKKIHNQLSPKGKLIIVVPANPRLYGKRDKNLGHYRRYSKKNLIKLLKQNNFKIKSIRYYNMIGILPYWFYEKILKKELTESIRTKPKDFLHQILNTFFNAWFKHIENNINLGFGFSLICIAHKDL